MKKSFFLVSALVLLFGFAFVNASGDVVAEVVAVVDSAMEDDGAVNVDTNAEVEVDVEVAADVETTTAVEATTFVDVLAWMHGNALTRYDNEEDFRGADKITRQEAANFVAKYGVVAELEATYDDCTFTDLGDADKTLLQSIADACALGLLKGGNGLFMPHDNITQIQAMVVVVRSLVGFMDETGDVWYAEYYAKAQELGIIGETTLEEGVDATRELLGTWFYNAAQVDMAVEGEMEGEMETGTGVDMGTGTTEEGTGEVVEMGTGDTMTGDVATGATEAEAMTAYELYSEELFQASIDAGKRVVLNFRASRCPTCQATYENLIANIDKLPTDVIVLEVDYDTYTELKTEYEVTQQTTFVFFAADGTFSKKVEDVRSMEDLVAELS